MAVLHHHHAVAEQTGDRQVVSHDDGRQAQFTDEAAQEIEQAGLTDRVLDDPREPYTQLLVSSILQV